MSNICNALTNDPQTSEVDYLVLCETNDYQRKIFHNRYWYVVNQIKRNIIVESPGRFGTLNILDAATGSGPGAAFISEQLNISGITTKVLGVDLNPSAIGYANYHYSEFAQYRMQDIVEAVKSDEWDVVVSMETLDHVTPDIAEKFVATVATRLNPSGMFICSSPRRRSRESTVKRPGHINEMYYSEFKYLLGDYFPRLEFASMDRYGNLIADTPDSNLMIASGYMPGRSCIFT